MPSDAADTAIFLTFMPAMSPPHFRRDFARNSILPTVTIDLKVLKKDKQHKKRAQSGLKAPADARFIIINYLLCLPVLVSRPLMPCLTVTTLTGSQKPIKHHPAVAASRPLCCSKVSSSSLFAGRRLVILLRLIPRVDALCKSAERVG